MTILQHAIAQAATSSSYQIARSLRFNSADSAYLNRLPSVTGNQKTWTYSGWVKRGAIGVEATIFGSADVSTFSYSVFNFRFKADNGVRIVQTNSSGAATIQFDTTAVFRDPSAAYHVHLAVDTTQATNSNGIKLWINGVLQAGTFTAYTQNTNTSVNVNTISNYIGRWSNITPQAYFDGYMADIRLIDGQALDPTSFGEFDANTGVWVPKAYTGTFGTNGFWLKFDDNSNNTPTTLGKDSSGNGNNWTPNNLFVTAGVGNDSLVDSPTNYGTDTGAGGEVRGNYCTLNPLDVGSGVTLSNGGLTIVGNANNRETYGTLAVSSGKWYFEATMTTATTNNDPTICIAKTSITRSSTGLTTPDAYGLYLYGGNAFIQKANNNVNTNTNATKAVDGDVIGIAFDLDAGKIWAHKNGTWMDSGSPTAGTNPLFSGLSGTFTPGGRCGGASTTNSQTDFNFGQRPFAYAAPSGFKALCSTNLPTPAIGASSSTLANKNFDVSLYTGNGGTLSIVNAGAFQPDLVWGKSRSAATANLLANSISGVGKYLISNTTAAEGTAATSVTAFNSNGFSLGADTTLNTNGSTYVAWQWKAGGAAVTNTAGTISSQVSANAAAGISVVTYTGTGAAATIGHGLGKAPSMIITKQRNGTWSWMSYHSALGATKYLYLNATDAQATDAQTYASAPTSTVWSVGTNAQINGNTSTYVSYVFAEVAGFSKFGSYTGNGSADGPFVYCGFRPRYVMVKRTDSTSNWSVYDTSRDTYNDSSANLLWANLSNAETALARDIDFLSNGFKLRSTDTDSNASGGTYIYMAFAESPFNYSRAR